MEVQVAEVDSPQVHHALGLTGSRLVGVAVLEVLSITKYVVGIQGFGGSNIAKTKSPLRMRTG
jgi:hypothetical protein